MISFITHLIRQLKLIANMGTMCFCIVNCWLSTYKVTKWFKIHHPGLLLHSESKQPTFALPQFQWAYLCVMDDFTNHTTITFHKIQRLTTLVAQQQAELDALVGSFIDDIGVSNPLTIESILDLDPMTHVFNGRYVISLLNVQEFLVGLVSWVEKIINEADEVKQNELWCDVGLVFILAYECINTIQFQRDANNNLFVDPYALLLVLPHKLVKMTTFNFLCNMCQHSYRLQHRYSFGQINLVVNEHKAFIQLH